MNAAVDHPRFDETSVRALNVVINFRTLRLPHTYPRGFYRYNAILTLDVRDGNRVALVWNRIVGLNNVGAVGQLVPTVISIGGLIKVMWALWRDRTIDEDRLSDDVS